MLHGKERCIAGHCGHTPVRHRFCDRHWDDLPTQLRILIERAGEDRAADPAGYWRAVKIAFRFFRDAEAFA